MHLKFSIGINKRLIQIYLDLGKFERGETLVYDSMYHHAKVRGIKKYNIKTFNIYISRFFIKDNLPIQKDEKIICCGCAKLFKNNDDYNGHRTLCNGDIKRSWSSVQWYFTKDILKIPENEIREHNYKRRGFSKY